MINDNDKYLISLLPATEHGQALMRWLQQEVQVIEDMEMSSLKICDDPIAQDFRFLLGGKIHLKRVMGIADEFTEELRTKSQQGG